MKKTLVRRLLAVAMMASMVLAMAMPASAASYLTLTITEAVAHKGTEPTTVTATSAVKADSTLLSEVLAELLIANFGEDANQYEGEVESKPALWAFESDAMGITIGKGVKAYQADDNGASWKAWIEQFAAKKDITGEGEDKGDLAKLILENKTIADMEKDSYSLSYAPTDVEDEKDPAKGNTYTFTLSKTVKAIGGGGGGSSTPGTPSTPSDPTPSTPSDPTPSTPSDPTPSTPSDPTPSTPVTPAPTPGTTTGTTTGSDGSKTETSTETKVETGKDGSTTVTENTTGTVTDASGAQTGTVESTTTTTTNKDGSTTAKTESTVTDTTTGAKVETKTESTTKTDAAGATTETSTTTETVKDANGQETAKTESTTTTTTNTDGSTTAVTESTTTKVDGTVTETKTESTATVDTTGAITETAKTETSTKQADGTKADSTTTTTTTITADAAGNITAQADAQVETKVELSKETSENAVQNDVAVVLPVEEVAVKETTITDESEGITTTITVKTNTAITVVTNTTEPVKVEIPVADATPGTVAVIVKADGTEQIVRDSVITENGVKTTVSDGDKVVIKDNTKTFNDVSNHWGENAVGFVAARGIFAGTGNDNFSPDVTTNRGMVVQVLHNLEYNETHTQDHNFHDVADHHWYDNAVSWAAEKQVVGGYGDGSFQGEKNVSREELVVMLWNYAGKKASDSGDHVKGFNDADKVSDWALNAMNWALENGILSGKGGKMLDPTGMATRAELAQMMKNFCENK